MKFIIKGPFQGNINNLMRKAGYVFLRNNAEQQELVFSRPAKGYPRFHIYLRQEKENLALNLHLDQKKPVYEHATAHAGEYNGKIVEEEAERIKQILIVEK